MTVGGRATQQRIERMSLGTNTYSNMGFGDGGDGEGDRDGEKGWQLYTEPIDLPPGDTTVHARAVRIGYLDSPESVAEFTVTPALSQ